MKILIKCLKQLSSLKNYKFHTEKVLLLFVTASYSGVHYICVLNTVHFSRASKKHQFSSKTIKTKRTALSNPESAVFMRILWGDCILTRGLTESVLFAPKPRAGLRRRALPVADEARRGWRSGQNLA